MGRIVSFHGHTKWEWGYKAFKRLYSAFTIDGLLATFCLPRLACNIIHVYEGLRNRVVLPKTEDSISYKMFLSGYTGNEEWGKYNFSVVV